MRLDLHNHTITSQPVKYHLFPQLQKLEKQSSRDIYVQAIKYHHLDGVAITNYHNIDIAMRLSKEYPSHVIVGGEYRVLGVEGSSSIQIVVLNIDYKFHDILMNARLRGVKYFTNLLREENLPFYLAHVGWGLSLDNEKAVTLFDSLISYFDAIEVLDASGYERSEFAKSIASYYNLAPIGGSGHIINKFQKAYTEAKNVNSYDEFFQAIKEKKVTVGMTNNAEEKKVSPFLKLGKNVYQSGVKKIWHSEFGLKKEFNTQDLLKQISQLVLEPTLQWIPKASHSKYQKTSDKKMRTFKKRFVDYLKLKTTKEIFLEDISFEEKKREMDKRNCSNT